MNTKINKKDICLEILRIIACFLVIVNHTNSIIFMNMSPSLTWFFSLLYFFVSKIAVPIFLMISGYLILVKDEEYKKTLFKIFRMVIILLVFSYINYFFMNIKYNLVMAFDFISFIKHIIKTPIVNSYWYIYLYIGILIMAPIIRKMIKNFDKKDYYYFFFWSLLFLGGYPIITHFIPVLKIFKMFDLMIFNTYLGIVLVGYYVHKYVEYDKKKLIIAIILFVVSISFSMVITYNEYIIRGGTLYLFFEDRILLNITLPSICFFYIVKCVVSKIKFSLKVEKIIYNISSKTFGIYLLSDLIFFNIYFLFVDMKAFIHPLLAMVILQIVIFILAYIIITILKKVPLINKII